MKKQRLELRWKLRPGLQQMPVGMRPLRREDADKLGALLYQTHKGNDSYEGECLANALGMVEDVFAGGYGPLLINSSFVIEQAGEVAAAILVSYNREFALPFIAYTMTHPAYRRRGYAEQLIRLAGDSLFHSGFRELGLYVTEDNSHARRLYERIGFCPPVHTQAAV